MKLKVDNPLAVHPDHNPEVLLYEEKAKEFRKMLEQSTTPQQIKDWLLEVCQANDTKRGTDGIIYTTPNWQARIAGIDRVMEVLRIKSSQPIQPVISNEKSTGTIIIQVIGAEKAEPKKIIEAKENEPGA